ncbi:hypothetical protein [Deinococcus humi]|uniref:Uncharacterized protein n=1 Tax=Deinococcus humi TaxID=662880 RepID=A0A7W8JUV8_9DEIO|nr:hypothetical protein [Deinococcus humi]MBB5363657.1 hypothetical protein [Deinococcus humi]GGO29892.1 hypothetical protein GCM10008949_24000 [Deinococcus humi]
MLLSQEEISFFKDPESWQYGPTYDLVFQFDGEVKQEAVFSLMLKHFGAERWVLKSDSRSLLVVNKPEIVSQPLGFLYYSYSGAITEGAGDKTHHLVMYPRQFEKLCGGFPHFWGKPPLRKLESLELHRLYFLIIGLLDKSLGLRSACLCDETHGTYLKPGCLLLLTETAEFLGLTGDRDDQDFDDTWRSFAIEGAESLISPL